jgi:hypothetical protein
MSGKRFRHSSRCPQSALTGFYLLAHPAQYGYYQSMELDYTYFEVEDGFYGYH